MHRRGYLRHCPRGAGEKGSHGCRFELGDYLGCTTFVPTQGCDYLEWIGFEFPWLTKRAWKALRGDTGFTEGWVADAERGKAYPTTMGITVWLWSAIASAGVKMVTGRWEVVIAPRYWYITPRVIEIRESVLYKGIVRSLIEEARG